MLLACAASSASALSVGSTTRSLFFHASSWSSTRAPALQLQEAAPSPGTDAEAPPAWYEQAESEAPSESAMSTQDPAGALQDPPEPEPEYLTMKDLINTKWTVAATPREDSWLKGGVRQQEFTLLETGSVVWGGSAGGIGTGGRWALKDGILEVIRSTPLGLVTGRDYYMAASVVKVDEQLQFTLEGIIRSYNALFPVMVIADFAATRAPGRFVMDYGEDEEKKE